MCFLCCKQVLCSKSVVAHRIDDDNNDGVAASSSSSSSLPPRCVQVCQWCNRWQTISSDVAYKKGSPVLGRFVINGLNRLHCAGPTTTASAAVALASSATAAMENDDDDEATREASARLQQQQQQPQKPQSSINRFPLCKYLAADRWCLQGIAFVSNQWLVCTCLNCERPYVRDFTVPETLQRVCKQCRNSVSTRASASMKCA